MRSFTKTRLKRNYGPTNGRPLKEPNYGIKHYALDPISNTYPNIEEKSNGFNCERMDVDKCQDGEGVVGRSEDSMCL